VTDARGHVSEFAYSSDGRLTEVKEKAVPAGPTGAPRDQRTSLFYYSLSASNLGSRGNLYQVKALHPSFVKAEGYPSSTDTLVTTTFYYDAFGNINRRVDPAGHNVWQAFTSRNFLEQVIVQVSPNPDSTKYDTFYEFAYDEAGNRTHVYTPYWRKDIPPGTSRRFAHNAWNLVEKEFTETNDSTAYAYDRAGNVASVRNPNGHVMTFQYDALNRVILKVIPQATQPYGYETDLSDMPTRTITADTLRWHYNTAGLIDTVRTRTDRVGRSYFLDGTLRSERQMIAGRAYDLSYAYDLAGRRTLLDHPTTFDTIFGTRKTTYLYSGPELQALTNPVDEVTQFSWDPMGRLTEMIQDNGVRTRRWYNDAGMLDSISVISPTHYIKYSSSPFISDTRADTIIFLTRHRYDADGLVNIAWEAHDARIYRNAVGMMRLTGWNWFRSSSWAAITPWIAIHLNSTAEQTFTRAVPMKSSRISHTTLVETS
jgi:YD repeat-containing protein